MAKGKHIDLTEDGVVTQTALLAYAEGKLSEPERREMEKLLKDDPFAQEALEGLRQSKTPNEAHTAITTINSHLREKTGARERKKKGIVIHWTVYAYAAVILGILVGIGFVMVYGLPYLHRQAPAATPQAQESKPVIEEKKTEAPKIDSAQLLAAQRNDSIAAAQKDSAAKAAATPDAGPTGSAKPNPASDAGAKTDANKASPATPSKTTMTDETTAALNAAKSYFEMADYANAEKKYNDVLVSNPDNADALYFGGICSYLDNSKGLGEANFDKLAKTGLYPEGTKWYKANILIRKGQKDAAKQLLRDLINTNSIFKDRAIKEYEDLYK